MSRKLLGILIYVFFGHKINCNMQPQPRMTRYLQFMIENRIEDS